MAEIPGATIDFVDYIAPGTPRVLNIPASAGNPIAQDIWDTLSAEAAKLDNLIYKKLIDRPKGGGKSTLSPGKATGITLPMNNIQIQFEPVVVKLETGTVTTADTSGRTLTDNVATFQTNNVERGDIVLNATDGSHATVLRVLSEDALVSTPLLGGTDNQYDSADSYEILDQVQRAITDGDVIAQDHLGAQIPAILTAFGVDSVVELSTSPALVLATSGPAKNVALPNFEFFMVLTSNPQAGATGLTITSQRSRDAEAFNPTDNIATEVSSGVYRIDLTADDRNGDVVTYLFTAPGADDRVITMKSAT